VGPRHRPARLIIDADENVHWLLPDASCFQIDDPIIIG
jgi:hypothetical protein